MFFFSFFIFNFEFFYKHTYSNVSIHLDVLLSLLYWKLLQILLDVNRNGICLIFMESFHGLIEFNELMSFSVFHSIFNFMLTDWSFNCDELGDAPASLTLMKLPIYPNNNTLKWAASMSNKSRSIILMIGSKWPQKAHGTKPQLDFYRISHRLTSVCRICFLGSDRHGRW